jgi:hypothetical protein
MARWNHKLSAINSIQREAQTGARPAAGPKDAFAPFESPD